MNLLKENFHHPKWKPETGQPLRILFAIAEADPWVKVGGLGDVAGALPGVMREFAMQSNPPFDMDLRLIIPFHPILRSRIPEAQKIAEFSIPHQPEPVQAEVWYFESGAASVYLVDGAPISANPNVYTADPALDAEKFVFFSSACLEFCRAAGWQPDILHANDWHTAPAVVDLKRQNKRDDYFANTRSILVIHNLPFMGAGSEQALKSYGYSPIKKPHLPEWAQLVPLPMGLTAADQIIAVSPTYAQEILTPQFGCGLEEFLASRTKHLSGILNGLNMQDWDPATDQRIPQKFSGEDLSRRDKNKAALQSELNLPIEPHIPLIALVSRMDQQKGVDLAIEALRKITRRRWQAVLMGTGNPDLEDACRKLAARFPGRVRAVLRYDAPLARRIYAGADALLMPSRYEPCGIAQMMAMRYGCLPIACATGGLKDTISDSPDLKSSTGFLFPSANVEELVEVLNRALDRYRQPAVWNTMQKNAMRQDFSWYRAADEYMDVYKHLLK